jgi:predicted DNA-binding transcriptional regulator YafY
MRRRAVEIGVAMRKEPATRLLQLARLFAAEPAGICLDEIVENFAVGRRTAERMRDAVAEVFPQLEVIEGERPKRWRLPNGLSGVFREPLANELAALHGVARRLKREDNRENAALLESLAYKIEASLKPARRRTLAPDIEALLEAEGFAFRPGPRPVIAPQTFAQIREAVLVGRRLSFLYRSESAEAPAYREVIPYGLLYGHRVYLVASFPWAGDPVNYRLDRMSDVSVSDETGARPRDFDLTSYADRSFGVFQERPHDVVLRFSPEVAEEVTAFQFHPTQTLTRDLDGSIIISFRAGGLREMTWHLFTWGNAVRIIAPKALKDTMRACIANSASTFISRVRTKNKPR